MKDETFTAWLGRVDDALEDTCGLTSEDLPDYLYRDAYEDGESPKRVARRAYRAATL